MKGKKMVKVSAGFIIALFFSAIVVMLFLSTRNARGISMGMDPVGNDASLHVLMSAERSSAQCFEFVRMHKKVCMHPGSELASGSTDKIVLDANFIAMVKFSKDDGRIPQISWFEMVRFPMVPRVFVHLSDGEREYGAGEGSTFEEAMKDLSLNFLAQEEEGDVEGVSTNHITIQI